VELSVRSLNLVFLLIPPVANDVPPPSTNLADSISEAAQLFAHEEITREESTEAYQAFQYSGAPHTSKDDDYVPGGLNPSTNEPEVLSDVDPTGISMFASMFEYLLSQFTFSAKDISITVIHPGHSSFRFQVSELRYGRPTPGSGESTRTLSISGVEIAHCDLNTSNSPSPCYPASRSRSPTPCELPALSHRVDNVALSSTVAFPSPPTPSFSLEGGSGSNEPVPSVKSSTPSTPEDRSQPTSPSGSTTSSLFQSALTTQGPKLPGTCEDTIDHSLHVGAEDIEPNSSSGTAGGRLLSQADEAMENGLFYRVIASLATEPIVVQITTSAPSVSSRPPVPNPHASGFGYLQPNLEISVSVGILACALTTVQISAILAFVSAIGSYTSPSIPPPISNNPGFVVPSLSLLDQAKLTLQIRGFVLLLQSVTAPLTSSSHDAPLADFFAHPLTPPKTNHSYVRFLIDRIKADLSVSTTLEQAIDESNLSPEHMPGRSRVPRVVRGTTASNIKFSIDDLSALAFCMPNNATARPASHATFVLPIVLTDHFLSTQYCPEHRPPPNMEHHPDISSEFSPKAIPALPEFEISDWTSEDNRTSQAKLSFWRVRPPPSHRRPQRDHLGDSPAHPPVASPPKPISEEKPSNRSQSALSGQISLSTPKDSGTGDSSEPTCSIQINIAPLHVFVDMGSIAAALDFLQTLPLSRTGTDSTPSQFGPYEPKGGDHEGASRGLTSPRRKTLQYIHQQELEDLNLSVDYLSKESVLGESPPALRKDQRPIQVFTYVLCSTFIC
jgi:autophagy-related protein 2